MQGSRKNDKFNFLIRITKFFTNHNIDLGFNSSYNSAFYCNYLEEAMIIILFIISLEGTRLGSSGFSRARFELL